MIDVVGRLRAKGMSIGEATAKGRLFAACAESLARLRGSVVAKAEEIALFVPGRIEVLGKHTDYAGGRSILCTVERGFAVLAVAREDRRVRLMDAARGEMCELSLDVNQEVPPGDWSAYAATVVRRATRDFTGIRRGVDIAFSSDLPQASGMSSSSALVIAVFLALREANHLSDNADYKRVVPTLEALSGYLGAVENGRAFGETASDTGVGTLGGSEDQTAILCCKPALLSQYSFCPVRAERETPFPADYTFVIAFSGIAAPKTASVRDQYNAVSRAASEMLVLWNSATGRQDACLADAVVSGASAIHDIKAVLRRTTSPSFARQRLVDRLDQFVSESFDIIPSAAVALGDFDFATFRRAVRRSQRGAEMLLGNQIPETIALARMAFEVGADAASAFGGGFGGSVWALVPVRDAMAFATRWRDAYRAAFPEACERAEFFATRPGIAATRL